MPERTCRFITLGCKANQYDTQLVRESLGEAGYREVAADEPADVCVVNTCTVTSHADGEARYEIRKLQRRHPGTAIVVMGCYAARAPDELVALPGVAAVVRHRDQLAEALRPFGVRRLANGISKFAGHHRAFVKVQDGCILHCTFCIIPQVRPSLRSRVPEDIELEVRRLVGNGFHEIVLTGIHLGHYGIEWSRGRPRRQWFRLSHLVRRLARVPGDWRLRLSSLEATEVTDDLVDVLASESRVCPHLHLCLQSGSDAVLAAMRRRYRVAGFLRRVERLRQVLDNPALTSDVIVGFPGESERDFGETLEACEAAGFSKMHIFPFSPRRGTPAAQRVPCADGVIRERKSRMQVLASRLAERYHRSLVGRRIQVLVERTGAEDGMFARGTACRYVPVQFHARASDEFRLVDVTVQQATATHVVGRGAVPAWNGARHGWQLPVLQPAALDARSDECPKGETDG